jgi:hypothetical protein
MISTHSVGVVATQGMRRPSILLKDGKKNKIRLRLRKMSFERELNELPTDLKALVELLIQSRSRANGTVYETVTIWNKVRRYEKYWTLFIPSFNSEAHFLSNYLLPDGATLGRWTVMVELFDKTTFILLGEEVLLRMMEMVGQYQSGTDERKRDYEIIFGRYCREHDAFDRVAFNAIVRNYVIERYEKQLAKAAGVSHQIYLKEIAKQSRDKSAHRSTVKASEKQVVPPTVQRDFNWKQDECSYCSTKTEIIQSFIAYTRKLEDIIRKDSGDERLPLKPENLQSLNMLQ